MISDQVLPPVSNDPPLSAAKVNLQRASVASLFDQLESLHKDAFCWALHCCNRENSLAEDVLQLAYVKAADGRAVFNARSSLKTWWFGVIRFSAREELRRSNCRQNLIKTIIKRLSGSGRDITENQDAPDFEAVKSAELQCLQEALAKLPGRQAETIQLVYYHSLTVAEAADVMKISVGSASQHLSRAKSRLKQLMNLDSD